MKKIIKIFLLVIGIFAVGGCNKKVVTDVSSIKYLDNTQKEYISHNLSEATKAIKGFKFVGNITLKNQKYEFNGEIILKASIKNSVIHINYKNSNIYLKNGNVYISYYYNNTNVIIKDDVDSFMKEIFKILEDSDVKFNENKILNVMNNKTIKDIDFNKIADFIEIEDNGYLIEYSTVKMYLNNNYLPSQIEYSKKGISLNVDFEYVPISINIPVGYNFLDIDLEGIKDLLKVENIIDLLDKK